MNKRLMVLAALVACVLVLVAGCRNPATGKPEAEVSEPNAETTGAATAEGREFTISDESSVGFTGSKITGSHEGGFEAFQGTILVGEGGPMASQVDVTIDTTSLWADDDRLAGHLKSPDFFDVETYPTARFSSTSVSAVEGGFELTGNLELHGVTKQITFPATISVEESRITAEAEFSIKRFDFDIVYPGKPDDLIRDEVVIRLNLVAVPAGA